MAVSAWTLILVCAKAFPCVEDRMCTVYEEISGLGMASVLVTVFCGLFTFFAGVMFCDQVKMIQENTGTIERLQQKRSDSNTRNKKIAE